QCSNRFASNDAAKTMTLTSVMILGTRITGLRRIEMKRFPSGCSSALLLTVQNCLRRRFARFKSATGWTRCGELCADLLDLRCLFLHGCCKTRNRGSQFLHFAMLLEELVEQHRVHCVVAHGVGFSVAIVD